MATSASLFVTARDTVLHKGSPCFEKAIPRCDIFGTQKEEAVARGEHSASNNRALAVIVSTKHLWMGFSLRDNLGGSPHPNLTEFERRFMYD